MGRAREIVLLLQTVENVVLFVTENFRKCKSETSVLKTMNRAIQLLRSPSILTISCDYFIFFFRAHTNTDLNSIT